MVIGFGVAGGGVLAETQNQPRQSDRINLREQPAELWFDLPRLNFQESKTANLFADVEGL